MARRRLARSSTVGLILLALPIASACGDAIAQPTAPPSSSPTSSAPTSPVLEIVVEEFYGAMPVPTTTIVVRADGCRDEPVADPPVDELVGDVDGNGRADQVRTHHERGRTRGDTLQVTFDDGRYSEPMSVETTDLLGSADLDGDGLAEIFVANLGNTGRGGGIVQVHGCALGRVRTESGEPFVYVFWGTGLGCAPSCYPHVECARDGASVDVVASLASRDDNMSGAPPPPLSDDLRYVWQVERWRLRDGVMVRVNFEQGTARHADLPVPKIQGFNCTPS